jgi:hypothetical protein
MVYFHTKKHNLGKFWRALKWKRLVFLRPLGIYKCPLVYFMAIRYSSGTLVNFCPVLVYCVKEKSGNPAHSSFARQIVTRSCGYERRNQTGN